MPYTYIYILQLNIAHPIDSISILTIPSIYEVNDQLMKSHSTSPTEPLPISLYHKFSPLFSSIFVGYYCELTKLFPGSPNLKTIISSLILKKILYPNSLGNYRRYPTNPYSVKY